MLFDSLNKLERIQRQQFHVNEIGTGAFIAGALGSAAISAGGSLASSALNSKWTYNQMRTQHEYELENMRKQQEWQEYMYNKSFKDASPVTQRKLIEEAGYNPYLDADSSAVGQVGSSPGASTSVSPGNGPYNLQLGADAVAQGLRDYVSLRNQEADTNLKKANARDLEAAGLGKEIQNQYAHQQMQVSLANQIADLSLKAMDYKKGSAEYDMIMQNVGLLKQQYMINQQSFDDQVRSVRLRNDNMEADTNLKNEQKAGQIIQNSILEIDKKYRGQFNQSQIDQCRAYASSALADVALKEQQGLLTKEEARHERQKIAKTMAEKLGIDNNNKLYPTLVKKLDAEIRQLNQRKAYGVVPFIEDENYQWHAPTKSLFE